MQAPNVQLYPGSTDTANVKKLQDYLVGLGLMTQAEVNTGYGIYGPKTTAAVTKLQQQLGVDTSAGGVGNYGPKTSAAAVGASSNQNTSGGLTMPSISGMPGLTPINNTPSNPFANISNPSPNPSISTVQNAANLPQQIYAPVTPTPNPNISNNTNYNPFSMGLIS